MTAPKLPRGSRVARISKWLSQQSNPLVTELHLETDTDSDTPDRVASWTRDKSFDPNAIAQEIDDILESIVAEQDQKVMARLVWLLESGARWTTFPIKIEPEGGGQNFDGTQRNLLIQEQRHLEGMALTYSKATQSVLATYHGLEAAYGRTIDALTRVIESRENRTADLETELARLRDENATLSAQALQTETIAEQAMTSAEQAAEELAAKRDSEGTDGQMLKLLSKVASDAMAPPARPPKASGG